MIKDCRNPDQRLHANTIMCFTTTVGRSKTVRTLTENNRPKPSCTLQGQREDQSIQRAKNECFLTEHDKTVCTLEKEQLVVNYQRWKRRNILSVAHSTVRNDGTHLMSGLTVSFLKSYSASSGYSSSIHLQTQAHQSVMYTGCTCNSSFPQTSHIHVWSVCSLNDVHSQIPIVLLLCFVFSL